MRSKIKIESSLKASARLCFALLKFTFDPKQYAGAFPDF